MLVQNNDIDAQNFGLKAAFNGIDNYVEHTWVDTVRILPNKGFSGRLANKPNYLKNLKLGDKVTFTYSQISDWNVLRDDKGYGYYTIRVMLDRLAAHQANQLRDFLSLTPVPNKW